jgi:hypothetical protein
MSPIVGEDRQKANLSAENIQMLKLGGGQACVQLLK